MAKEPAEKSLLERIWDAAKGFFIAQREAWFETLTTIAPDIFGKIFKGFSGAFNKGLDSERAQFLSTFKQLGIIDDDDIKALDEMMKPLTLLRPFFSVMTWTSLWKAYFLSRMDALTGTFRQKLNKLHSPMPPMPGDVLRTAFIAPEKINEVRDAMQRHGMSDADIDLMLIGAYATYPPELVSLLYLRGILTEDKMRERMREIGFTDTRIDEMKESWKIIPSIQDILYMTGKEAFEPDMIEHIGLGDEFPEDQVKWAEMQGLSREWTQRYWYAHWEQPSIQMGYEMLHRNVITHEELDMLFRAIEIPPFWRERLLAISFNPYTRVDTRRMYDFGIIDFQGVYDSYREQGYDHEHATNLAKYTVAASQEEGKNLSKAEVLKAYKEKALPRDRARELLIELGYTVDQAEYYLTFEDYKFERDLQDDMIENVRLRYQENLIEKNDVISLLGKMGLPASQMNVLIDKWEIKKFTDRKLPSKTDIGKWRLSKLINDDEYREEMRKIGYNFVQIDRYLALLKKTAKAD